jgi:subtilisin family serine protease
VLGLVGRPDYAPVDVVVLSLGYYHERPEDAAFDAPFGALLKALRRYGVLVVVSSGNDGQTRPSYPAAFAPRLDRKQVPPVPLPGEKLLRDEPPVLTVGATNPDGTVALFSNDGPWVTCTRPGASLVSTAPTTIDGAVAPSRSVDELWGPGRRATIDPEGFQGGFATWSGTSFAAPVLAGELASHLLDAASGRPDPDPELSAPGAGDPARCAWLWGAITLSTGLVPTEEQPTG